MSSEPDGKGSEAINGYAVRERADSKVDCLEDDSATKTLDHPDATNRLEKDESFKYDPETMDKLSEGLLKEYVDDLKRVRANLADLTKNQHLLIDTVQQENGRFSEVQEMYHIEDVFQRAKLYHAKLVKIKKDMADLYQRSKKLKKRALKLQQQKQKEALQTAQQRERELEREKQLLAKVALRSPQS
uniref:Biogenesis of lysosome-related organelles complex 1 subunit 6 n=1 Tax=Ixodes ricinus TaxID=34613 RepID=A0A131XPJ2_IXORI